MTLLVAQISPMTAADQWNWVLLAYGFTFLSLVAYTASVAIRLSRARRRLDERS